MKMTMIMSADEVKSIYNTVIELIPEEKEKVDSLFPVDGVTKMTKYENLKMNMVTHEDSNDISMSFDMDPEYFIDFMDLISSFAGGVASAVKSFIKHYALLIKIAGKTETIEKFYNCTTGMECNKDGSDIENTAQEDSDESNSNINKKPVYRTADDPAPEYDV